MGKKMLQLFAGMIGWFGFGIIYAEVLNNFNLFDFKLKAYFVEGSMSLSFLIFKLILKIYNRKARDSIEHEKKYGQILTIYHICLGLIFLICLLSLPFLWWGIIMNAAKLANEGKMLY